LDFIIILGDYFDHKLYLNDQCAKSAMYIMEKVLDYAKSFGAFVRIVYGTASHECNQYSIFQSLFDKSGVDVKVIQTVADELINGLSILYLPEEYIFDKNDYYKEYLYSDKKYDYIFGHGVIKEVMTEACRTRKSNTVKRSTPYFTTAELKKACNKEVYFGHYHINTTIKDNIHYVGSFSSWKFGENKSDKGFYIIDTDDDSNTFIKNTFARKYNDIIFTEKNDIFNNEEQLLDELDKIDNLINLGTYNMVKLHVHFPKDFNSIESYTSILTNRYSLSNNVKLDIDGANANDNDVTPNDNIEIDNEYETVFNTGVPIEEKIRFFIKHDFGEDIDLETIRECLNITYG